MYKFYSEIRALTHLALPVSLAHLAVVGMTATDVLIAGNASTTDLAGMNLGSNTWNMIVFFFLGIGLATQPLVARAFGAGDMSAVKTQLHQSLWLCGSLGLLAMLGVLLSAYAISWLDFENGLRDVAKHYLLVISLAAIPFVAMPAVRGTLEGLSYTKPILWIFVSAFALNIPLDYMLVNGLYGFPKLGGVGCAWATVVLVWAMFIANCLVLLKHPELRKYKLLYAFNKPDWQRIKSTLSLGLPIAVSVFIELSMFAGAGMMIALFGSVETGAHAVAIALASMSFMLYMGLAQGVTIRASQFIGAGKQQNALYTVKSGSWFNLVIAALICAIFLLFNRFLISLFSADPAVVQLAVVLLYYGAAFQLADCLQVAMMHALRAYHDTRSPPLYQFIAFWVIGLPMGVWLAFYAGWPQLAGAKGMWLAMVSSLLVVGLLLLRRLTILLRYINI